MEFTVEFIDTDMKKTNFDLYLEEQLKDPGFAQKFIKAGEAWDVAIQLVSLRKKAGLSQKELAKRVGTSQQQISRLESPSYEGHSLSMLRRVADVLAASVHVEIRGKKQQPPPVVAEAKTIYRAKSTGLGKQQNELQKFELDFLKKEKVDIARNFRIAEALYREAVTLGIIPLKDPLDGIEVDLKIARVVNSV
jgi:transcriptional regulator with XRE-family HTH domain